MRSHNNTMQQLALTVDRALISSFRSPLSKSHSETSHQSVLFPRLAGGSAILTAIETDIIEYYQSYRGLNTIRTLKTSTAMARVIALTSGKGGVGKTTIAVNLGIALATRGHRVCLFDADTGLANVNILLGQYPKFTLQHLLSGEKSIRQILYRGPRGLYVIPAASGVANLAQLSGHKRQRLLANLRAIEKFFDYLVIDTAAGIDRSVQQFVHAADCPIIVISPEPTSLTDAFALLRVLKSRHSIHPGVLVNRVNNNDGKEIFQRFARAVKRFLDIEVTAFGNIASDDYVQHSIMRQQPYIITRPYSVTGKATYALATQIVAHFQHQSTIHSISRYLNHDFTPGPRPVVLHPIRLACNPKSNDRNDHGSIQIIQQIQDLKIDAADYQKIARVLENKYQKEFGGQLFSAADVKTRPPQEDLAGDSLTDTM